MSSEHDIWQTVDTINDSIDRLTALFERLQYQVTSLNDQNERQGLVLAEQAARTQSLEVDLDKLWMFRPRNQWPYPKQALSGRHQPAAAQVVLPHQEVDLHVDSSR